MAEHYQYYAFVSYSRKDEKWAKWLQTRLENYRLPAAIRKDRLDVPARIRPVFRDKTDLAGGFLEDELHKELASSRNLIIICSPNSAGSEWVNKEIAHFIAMGRAENIIPFIVDGTPNAEDPERECFPRALREMEKEPLGIDIQDLGKNEAFLKVVSTLLDVRHDQIAMRDKRRRFRNYFISGFFALTLAIAAGAGIWWNTPHSKYYHNYITRYEIPEGIHEMTRQELAHASESYRITTLRGNVIKLERVNSAGTPVDPILTLATSECAVMEYTYDDSGRLVSVDQRDSTSQLLSRKVLTYNDTGSQIAIDFRSPSNAIQAQALSADVSYQNSINSDADTKSEITRQLNTYDENGLLLTAMFQRDNLGSAACDSTGVYGKRYEYTDRGQVARVSNLDAGGQLYNCRYGWATIEYTYDEMGNALSTRYYDAAGNQTEDESDIAMTRYAFDAYGNALRAEYFDVEGNPSYGENGVSVELVTYGENGYPLALTFWDSQGNPVHDSNGFHEVRQERDALGRITEEWYYDTQGELVCTPLTGCAGFRWELDSQGRITAMWYYDAQGALTYLDDGYCGMTTEYDENGYISAIHYWGAQEELVITKRGYSFVLHENDPNGNILTTSYFDTEGDPVRNYENIASSKRSYDTFGNCVSMEFFDENGEPCISSYGYASSVQEYENGNQVSFKAYDTYGEPILTRELFFEQLAEYDETGNCIRKVHYGTDGSLINRAEGYAIQEKDYDAYGNITEWRWYDAELSPVRAEDGYFRVADSYDSRGDLVRRERYADPNEPEAHTTLIFTYDLYHNIIRQDTYDTDGQRMDSASSAAEARMAYDAAGNLLRRELYGPDGLPWLSDNSKKVNLYEYSYDTQGNQTLTKFLHMDADGREICLWQERKEYDAFGNRVRADRLDGNGRPVNSADGYATILNTYTATGEEASVEYYDENGEPCTNDGITFRKEYEYDAMGNVTETRWFGPDGKPLREADGLVAVMRSEYDARGLEVSRKQYNERGELYTGENGTYAIYEFFYDAMGDRIGTAAYDSTGALVSETVKIVIAREILEESVAQAAGVQVNDILLRYGDWEFYDETSAGVFHELTAATDGTREEENKALLCRYDGNSFRFYWVTFPKTGLGVRFTDTNCASNTEEALHQAYDNWMTRK